LSSECWLVVYYKFENIVVERGRGKRCSYTWVYARSGRASASQASTCLLDLGPTHVDMFPPHRESVYNERRSEKGTRYGDVPSRALDKLVGWRQASH
jgi:hypothetical protein